MRNHKLLGRSVTQHIFYCLNIVVPLIFGSAIYVCYRPDTYISQFVYNTLGISPNVGVFTDVLPAWVVSFIQNYLADILWAYSLTFTVYYIWRKQSSSSYEAFGIVIAFEFCIEFSQKPGIMSGTFDWIDIFLEVCITVLATLLIKSHDKESQI